MKQEIQTYKVNYKLVFQEIWKRRKLYFIGLPIVFILSCLFIISIPRTYTSETKMAPEIDSPTSGGALGSLASSFGFDLSEIQSSDAITPLLYPQLIDDNGFISELFGIKVTSQKGEIKTDLYTYYKKYQKFSWWSIGISAITNFFKSKKSANASGKLDPYFPSKQDNEIMSAIRKSIKIRVKKKTGVITIKSKAQDALICKIVADSVRGHLQQYITRYRTNKARKDYAYYKSLTEDAKAQYEKARRLYGGYADANSDVILESFKSKQDDLENDMQLKYNTYSTLNTQLQAAKAKIQEKTPAFTLIQGAAVPIKASEPKRMLFVFGATIFAFILISIYVLKDIIKVE